MSTPTEKNGWDKCTGRPPGRPVLQKCVCFRQVAQGGDPTELILLIQLRTEYPVLPPLPGGARLGVQQGDDVRVIVADGV